MQRVDLQFLLGLRSPLLGRDDAVADGRPCAVPEALPGVFVHGAQDVLGVLLGLVFVEQRHDLPHHLVHGVIPHFLRDRHQLDAVLRQLPDVEFHLEMIAEEAREAMHHDNIEGRGLGRASFDHALELGALVVGGGCARLDIRLNELVAALLAICFALPLLVGNGNIMLGLSGSRDAQVEGGAGGNGWAEHVHGRSPMAFLGFGRSIRGNASSTRSCTTLGASLRP
nr:hypothetical protein [Bordetella bronchiseptica]